MSIYLAVKFHSNFVGFSQYQLEDLSTKLLWEDGRPVAWTAHFPSFRCLSLSPRFVSCLLEQPEVLVTGAGRGHAGRIIHKLFVNAQRVCENHY